MYAPAEPLEELAAAKAALACRNAALAVLNAAEEPAEEFATLNAALAWLRANVSTAVPIKLPFDTLAVNEGTTTIDEFGNTFFAVNVDALLLLSVTVVP